MHIKMCNRSVQMPQPSSKPLLDPAVVNLALAGWPEEILYNPFDIVVKFRTSARALPVDSSESAAWHCLADVFYYQLSVLDPRRPFSPMMVMTNGTSATPETLSSQCLDWLEELLPSVDRLFARARIGDVLWYRKRHYVGARIATEAYLDAGVPLLSGQKWFVGIKYVTRGCQLAAFIGELDQKIEARVLGAADEMLRSNKPGIALDLVVALKPAKTVDKTRCLSLLKGIRQTIASTGGIGWRNQHEKAADIAEHLKDPDLASSFRTHLAKGLEIEAENDEHRGDYLRASFIWQSCLEASRKAQAPQSEIDRIQRRLIEANLKQRPLLERFSVEFDLKPLADEACSKIRGKSTEAGIMILAHFLPLPDFERERHDAIQELEDHPIQQLVTTMPVDRYGRAQAPAPSYFSPDKDEREAAIRRKVIERRQMYRWGPQAVGAIRPALRILIEEHSDLQEALVALVASAPFVPGDRQELFAAGLLAGVQGDFAVAVSLLIPQVENAIRSVLEQNGVTVTRLTNDGSQEDRSIGALLQEPILKSLLSAELVDELDAVLDDRHGPRFRHMLAHGRLSAGALGGPLAIYSWWLALHLVATSITRQRNA